MQTFQDVTGGAGLVAPGPHSLLDLTLSAETGAWFLILDQTTIPVNGDRAAWQVYVPGLGTAFTKTWTFPFKLTKGLAFAWSDNPAIVSLTALHHVAADGQYV